MSNEPEVYYHREPETLGGNIIEIKTDTARVIFDCGTELEGAPDAPPPEVPGLFTAGEPVSAVFITHYHQDHAGFIDKIIPGVPVYMGKKAAAIMKAYNEAQGRDFPEGARICGFLKDGATVTVGDITVTPFLCDHSAADSYMLLAEAYGKRILYTGDFRSNGRKSFPALLSKLPRDIDLLIREGTLEGSARISKTERELEKDFLSEFLRREGKPVFVLSSSTNLDRLVTVYKAARKCGRIVLTDPVLSSVAEAAGGKIPRPGFPGVYAFTPTGNGRTYAVLKRFKSRLGKARIAEKPFVMFVRASMGEYLKKLSEKTSFEGGALVYSTWEGYEDEPQVKDFLDTCASLRLETVYIHTSGHADANAVKALIERTRPRQAQIVHTAPKDKKGDRK
ncbi:MAG: MBL fold metallo-hydrolase [Clostridia bacterium]|nr:MBL fold metallo-hydrolase [Clostridia bacterium]